MADEPFIGGIFMWASSILPRGYAFCTGQLLSIAQNQALFSILGTTYGGDGITTFALPNLKARFPIGTGQSTVLGQVQGNASVTLTTQNLPAHTHQVTCSTALGTTALPEANVFGVQPDSFSLFAPTSDGGTMAPAMIGNVGGSQPLSVQNPYITINYIIALTGVYPSRS